MTFIQPNQPKNLVNLLLAVLAIALFSGTFWLIIAYNQTVNLTHNIATTKAELDSIGANNTVLNNQLVNTMGGGELANVVAADNLVEEKSPHYFPINQQWSIVSR